MSTLITVHNTLNVNLRNQSINVLIITKYMMGGKVSAHVALEVFICYNHEK